MFACVTFSVSLIGKRMVWLRVPLKREENDDYRIFKLPLKTALIG